MRRREFIVFLAGAVAFPLAAYGQQVEHVRRIGILIGYAKDDPETKTRLAAFRRGLEKRGWTEGHNVHIDTRFAGSGVDKYGPLANELVASKPDVILAHTTPVTLALKRATQEIPIVFVNVSDPVGSGFISDLAHPGHNLTGVQQYEASVVGKWILMLKEVAPHVERVVLIGSPKTSPYDYFVRAAENAARALAVTIVPNAVGTAADIKSAIDSAATGPNGALLVPPDATTIRHRNLILELAARHRLPAVYAFRFFVAQGGLMSYGTDQNDMFRLAASYVDRILRGDKAGELPVQTPVKFETTVNLATAKTLGLTIPPSLLVAADEVIE